MTGQRQKRLREMLRRSRARLMVRDPALAMVLMYMSAIFYTVDELTPFLQAVLYLNPIYSYIRYFRIVVLACALPPLWLHLLCFAYAAAAAFVGGMIYKKYNHRFLYYV